MKIVIVLSFVALSISTASIINSDEITEIEWNGFKSKYGKTYHDPKEENKRRQIYKSNKMIINTHNEKYDKGQVTYSLGINQFADMTLHEFSTKMNGFKRNLNGKEKNYIKNEAKDILNCKKDKIPIAEDWRKKGYVTHVKDQKACGSCWAFSATGSLEGQHFRKSGILVSLSEQNLIDCSTCEYNNHGCNGGDMNDAFQYIKDNIGIDTEEFYPYEAKDSVCRYKFYNSGATVKGFVNITEGDEDALLCAVATVGPVSVAIDATSQEFQFYRKGLFYNPKCSSNQLSHGLLAVGFDTNENGPYWIVKNSYGSHWGNHGYIHMARNRNNNCGIATVASYPLV